MSKYSNLPNKIIQSLFKLEKKIISYPLDDKIKKFKQKYKDTKDNRELIVVDKFGNRYYQYYSHHGLPTRRVIENNFKGHMKWDDDPFMLSWLQKRRDSPPSQEELEKMYVEHEEFLKKGLEWDRKEKALIDEWKKKQNEALEKEREETKAIGTGDDFTPGIWDKTLPVLNEEIEINVRTEDTYRELALKNDLEIIKDDKYLEGRSTLPGKYMVEYQQEDKKWMEREKQKMMEPYNKLIKQIDFSPYTMENMTKRNFEAQILIENELKEEKQRLTNIGKTMLAKKDTYVRYNNFRKRFKDVFAENDMEIKEE